MGSGGSVCSSGELCCGGEGVDCFAVGGGGGSEPAWCGVGGAEFGQPGGQDAVVDGGEELRGVQAVVGDLVAVGARDPGDQVAGFEPAQVVGRLSDRDGGGVESAQFAGECAQVLVGEPVGVAVERQ